MIEFDYSKKFRYDSEILNNLSESYFQTFRNRLLNHPNYKELKSKFILDENEKSIVQILDKIPIKEIIDLTEEEKYFYPLCNKEEIKKIFNPQSANDYLLKIRAENISNNIRLHRLFISIRKKYNNNWSFSDYINSKLFNEYLYCLPKNIRDRCNNIPTGLVHLNEPNGYCEKTPFGYIIVISEALQHFLYFMNLFALGSQLGLDKDDVYASFFIAVKTMLGTEALDFEIDSRGDIPSNIHRVIQNSTNWQLKFIIGHEYTHHYLGHLDCGLLKKVGVNSNSCSTNRISVYSYNQNLEFEADLNSISSAKNKKFKNSLTIGAFYFFHFLDLFETVINYISPKSSLSIDSHPKAIDRLWKLRESLDENIGIPSNELKKYLDSHKAFKDSLYEEILPFHINDLESYGSLYLPNLKKEIKYDRLDF